MSPLLWLAVLRFTPSLTLTLPAMPVSQAGAESSRQSGILLTASGDTRNEIVCMRVVGAAPDQVLEKLAFCLNASWEKQGLGFEFVRTGRQKQEEDDEEYR